MLLENLKQKLGVRLIFLAMILIVLAMRLIVLAMRLIILAARLIFLIVLPLELLEVSSFNLFPGSPNYFNVLF